MDIQKAVDALQPVADKLGQGAGHAYQIYVRQSIIMGYSDALFSLVWLAVAITGYKLFRWLYAQAKMAKQKSSFDGDGWYAFAVGSLVAVVLSALIGLFLLSNSFTHFVNPEYDAINNIICSATQCGGHSK